MLLFSTYSTLKYVLFIRVIIIHNSTCKRETSFTVLVTNYVTFLVPTALLKYVLFIVLNIFHNSTCKRETSFTGTKKYL